MIAAKRMVLSAFVTAVAVAALGGCVVRARTRPVVYQGSAAVVVNSPPPPQATATVVVQPAAPPPPMARPACGGCVQGGAEICNGCDDNCNGVIDEGC